MEKRIKELEQKLESAEKELRLRKEMYACLLVMTSSIYERLNMVTSQIQTAMEEAEDMYIEYLE